jgi:hypothetical protein
MKYTIRPYVSNWDQHRVWVFDDPKKGLKNEGLVSGTDQILDMLAKRFPDGENGFELTFSDEPFDGHELTFDWIKSGTGEGLAEGVTGNWYRENSTGFEGWLCPALFLYFKEAPKHIYIKAESLKGTLERGTGRVIIQGKKSDGGEAEVACSIPYCATSTFW